MGFEFATANRIIFGAGTLSQAGPAAARLGSRALVVTGSHTGRAAPLLDALTAQGVGAVLFSVPGEPTTDLVEQGTALARCEHCDLVIGLGGGSPLDAAKAIAALLTNGGTPLDYLEVVGRGETLSRRSAPLIAIPTTAGTGTEVTANAVLASPEHGIKASLRSPLMLPALALVDPDLSASLPPEITAASGLDTLTQLVEPFVSNRANPLTDALCREGLNRAARALRRAYRQGDDRAAREDMALAALLSGLAMANAGLGAVHGLAGPVGGRFPAPHGAVCGCLLPHVMAANREALLARAPGSPALARYDEIARIVTGRPDASAPDGIAWVSDLCAELAIPPLSAYGITTADVPDLAAMALIASSTRKNPVELTAGEMEAVLLNALHPTPSY